MADLNSNYETPILKILVGDEEAMFKINEGLLQGTSFFAEHGRRPPRASVPVRQAPATPTTPPNQAGLFFDDVSEHTVDSDDEAVTIDLTDSDADYELKGKFYYSRDAFNIFVRHLNEAPPITPKNQEGCWSLFKAYALAQHYNVELLQNHVIDALQKYYIQNTVPITDVIFAVQHWGDNVDCFLVSYLVAQAGYEIASDWASYRGDNVELVALFQSGNKGIIEELFRAAMDHTKPNPSADPAKYKRNWRLQPL